MNYIYLTGLKSDKILTQEQRRENGNLATNYLISVQLLGFNFLEDPLPKRL